MSAVTEQPLPFGPLEREKHIQMLFRAFRRQHRTSCDPRDSPGTQARRWTPAWGSEEQPAGLASGSKVENVCLPSPGQLRRPEVRELWPGDGSGMDSLEMLETISRLNVVARPELQGPHCVPRRTYSVTAGGSREQLFVVVEESSCLCLQCCGPARSCSLQGFDDRGHQVFHFQRPLRVDACCFGCCLMEMRVYTPQNQLLGTVRQRWSMFTPLLEVCDAEGISSIQIQGSCCPCRCLSDQEFQVVLMTGEKIGTIWKKWPGFNAEYNMDHESFGLDVPLNMEAHSKLLLLAAAFLLSHMFFEMS